MSTGSTRARPTPGVDTVSAMRRSQGGFLSPVVRRLLAEHGIAAQDVQGTGNGGRITRGDVEAVIEARAVGSTDAPESGAPRPEPAAAGAEPTPSETPPSETTPADGAEPPPPAPIRVSSRDAASDADEAVPAPEDAPAAPPVPAAVGPADPVDEETLVPFSKIRRRIATNLRESVSSAAHAFCAVEADFERIDRLRRVHADAWKEREGFSLTYLPFVARAVCAALGEFPNLNASVVDDGLLVRHRVHLGIAVDLEHEGLIVPVVHDADRLGVADLAQRIADLATRAREQRLGPDDVTGGTFTVTNPGPHGTILSVPIINQPQVGILATDTVRRRPVMLPTGDGGEGITIHAVGTLGLSFDHRGIDGAYAAAFTARVAAILQTHDWEPELTPAT